jgi:hypothetical protein
VITGSARRRSATAVLLVVLAVLALPAASTRAAYSDFPGLYFWAWADVSPDLDQVEGIDLTFGHLDRAGDTERVVITLPRGFGANLSHAVGSNLGSAALTASGGKKFSGQLVEMDPTAYEASASAQACDSEPHVAIWEMNLTSSGGASLVIPIAIDQMTSSYQLTMCFDDEHAENLEVSGFDFYPENLFTTPSRNGHYVFDAIVTAFGAGGAASPTTAYELRSHAYFPYIVTASASYNPATRLLTVSGKVSVLGKPKAGMTVDVSAGASTQSDPTVGSATTAAGGKYVFKKRLAKPPRYAYTDTRALQYPCLGSSPAPAGCRSAVMDNSGSDAARVRTNRSRG